MKVMSVTAVNASNYNQKTNEQQPSFKALKVTLFPKEKCSRQGLVGFLAIIMCFENTIGKGASALHTKLGIMGKKIVGIINTNNNHRLEKAINKCFFDGEATFIPDEKAKLLPPVSRHMDILRAFSDVLADAEKLANKLSPTESQKQWIKKASRLG